MEPPFDPYHRWLGIPPADQPPNHYRLLGLGLFESESDVIESSADRQMAHVRTFQTGRHSAISQRLLNEISAAKVCLLNPAQKSAYDRNLSAHATSPVRPATAATFAPAATPIARAIPVASPHQTSPLESGPSAPLWTERPEQRSIRRQPVWTQPAVIAGGVALSCLVMLLAWRLTMRDERPTAAGASRRPALPAKGAKSGDKIPSQVKLVETADPFGRRPPPGEQELRQAMSRLRQIFGKGLSAASTPEARQELSRKLRERADASVDEPALRYALLAETRRLAVEAGDAQATVAAVKGVGQTFAVDTLSQTADSLERAANRAKAPAQQKSVIFMTALTQDEAYAGQRYDVALRLARLALAVARRSPESARLAPLMEARVKRAETSQAQAAAYEASMERLTRNPASSDDNLAVGKYLCLTRGDWQRGLPLLAKGSDPKLKELAVRELAGAAEASKQTALAKAWLAAAASQPDAMGHEYRGQAKYWLYRALQTSPAADRETLGQRVAEIAGFPWNRLRPGLVSGLYNGLEFEQLKAIRIADNIDRNFGGGGPHGSIGVDHFSVRWTGWLLAPLAGKYKIVTFTDDGVRLWIDNRLVIDFWGAGAAGRREVEVELDGAPHELRMDFNDIIVTGAAILAWSWEGTEVEQVVPPIALAHDAAQVAAVGLAPVLGKYEQTLHAAGSHDNDLLILFEDQPEFVAELFDGTGLAELDASDKFSGSHSVKVTPQQRHWPQLPGLRAAIREHPGPGEYRYLRFAWKKRGGDAICIQLAHSQYWGPSGENPGKFRYDASPLAAETFGGAVRISPNLPTEWTVVTRDLFADFGEFAFTGLALTPIDGECGWFDSIYLARRVKNFPPLPGR